MTCSFIDLPKNAKKAIIQYFALDSFNEDFNDILSEVKSDNISEDLWNLLIKKADSLWSKDKYSLKALSVDDAKKFIMENSPDISEEYSDFNEYHESYCEGFIPDHATNSWPVLAMPSCGEALLDGWHRFHSYIKNKHSHIYFLNLDAF